MKVGNVATHGLVQCRPEDRLIDAAGAMVEHEVGSLPVVRGPELVGIVTERDLVRATADGVDAAAATVAEFMSLDPVTVRADADLMVAARLMLEAGVRHLPVIEHAKVIGMVSIRDVVVEEVRS